jgi:hypothetical protein
MRKLLLLVLSKLVIRLVPPDDLRVCQAWLEDAGHAVKSDCPCAPLGYVMVRRDRTAWCKRKTP